MPRSIDRSMSSIQCAQNVRQSGLNCLGWHFSLSYLIEIIQRASPGLKCKSTAVSAHVQFISDQLVFRFTLRVDGMPGWASPVTAFNGSGQRSPFVALAAR
jgi:hypothetical protein